MHRARGPLTRRSSSIPPRARELHRLCRKLQGKVHANDRRRPSSYDVDHGRASVSSRSDPPRGERDELLPYPSFPDEESRRKGRRGENPFNALSPQPRDFHHTSSSSRSTEPSSSRIRSPNIQELRLPTLPTHDHAISENPADGFPVFPPPINPEDDADGYAHLSQLLPDLKVVTTRNYVSFSRRA